MKIFHFLKRGAVKAIMSYKLILVIWLVTLLSVFFVALPLRSSFGALFGSSMAADMLLKGFDAGIMADMGSSLRQLLSAASKGGFILLLTWFFLYAFFAGGLFSRYTSSYSEVTVPSFMKASARHFAAFLGIMVFFALCILLLTVIVVVLPPLVIISVTNDTVTAMKVSRMMYIAWLLLLPLLLLPADHARRWVASTGSHRLFRAIREGFSSLGKRFIVSYLSMLIILITNIVFMAFTAWLLGVSVPEDGLMVFLLFMATQLLFIIRLLLKAWRYATVTELSEYYR